MAKITGKEGLYFKGKARCFDSENDMISAIESGSIKKGEKTVSLPFLKGICINSFLHRWSYSAIWAQEVVLVRFECKLCLSVSFLTVMLLSGMPEMLKVNHRT